MKSIRFFHLSKSERRAAWILVALLLAIAASCFFAKRNAFPVTYRQPENKTSRQPDNSSGFEVPKNKKQTSHTNTDDSLRIRPITPVPRIEP